MRVSTIRNSVLGRPDAGSTLLGSRRSEQEAGSQGFRTKRASHCARVTIRGGIHTDRSLDG